MIRTILIALAMPFCTQIHSQIDFKLKEKLAGSKIDQLDSLIHSGKYENISSILVAQNGELILEKYYNNHDISSLHNTRSATKTMATILTGIAIDQGFIHSEKDFIFKYLESNRPIQNPDPRKDKITIEDLLTMSSVLECDDWNEHSRGHEMKMYFIEDWTQFLLDLPVRSFPFNGPPETRPYGRAFAYASAKSAAVGDIVERAVGMKLDSFFKSNVLTPLGIKDYKLHYSPKGVLNTAGGSEYRSRDLLKFIQLLLNNGKWNGDQLVSSEWVKKAISPHAHAYDDFDYGYFLWLSKMGNEKNYQAFYMSGNGGNKIMAIPEIGVSLVLTAKNYNNRNAHNYSYEIINDYLLPAIIKEK